MSRDAIDGVFRIVLALGTGYLLGGTWQAGLGAVGLQLLFAMNGSDILTGFAKIAKAWSIGK
jgi:hypothetical protein